MSNVTVKNNNFYASNLIPTGKYPYRQINHSEVILDESDPFESAMADIVKMFRKKNADYARPNSRWSNFEDMSRFLGAEDKAWLSSLVLCQQKLSRIGALVSSGKTPTNESLIDSLLDNAVYAAMALAMAKEKT